MADTIGNVIGARNFRGGETLIERVSTQDSATLEKCDGFKIEDGVLREENLVDSLTATAVSGGLVEQVPMAFVDEAVTSILARTSDGSVYSETSGTWSDSGVNAVVVEESTPARWKKQVIFPTTTGMKIYEPDSPSTKIRPLGFSGPGEYSLTPTVAASALAPQSLFDCNDGNDWAAPPLSTVYTVSTSGDKTTMTITSGAVAGATMFTKSLGSSGVATTDIEYLMLDIKVQDDLQQYPYAGMFPNNASLYPSGYIFTLYSDELCATKVASYYLPNINSSSKVTRVLLKVTLSEVIKGISLDAASFFTPPTTNNTYTITVYSEPWVEGWGYKGNVLLPNIAYPLSPLAVDMNSVTGTSDVTEVTGANVILNAGFETHTVNWATVDNVDHWTQVGNSDDAGYVTADFHSGTACCVVSQDTYVYQNDIPVNGGKTYEFGFWHKDSDSEYRTFSVTVAPKTVTDEIVGAVIISRGQSIGVWSEVKASINIPDNATKVTLTLAGGGVGQGEWQSGHGTFIDDVTLCQVDNTSSKTGAVAVLQTFSEDGNNRVPETPLVRYSVAYAGKDQLSVGANYNSMVSNPSDPTTPDTMCDPWRTYTITLAGGSAAIAEYGSYITHALFYRQIYDGASDTWSDWTFFASTAIGASVSVTDAGIDSASIDSVIDNHDVPITMEITNTIPSIARYVVSTPQGRVVAAGLDYSAGWTRKTAIQVSSQYKPWAFPTIIDEYTLVTDGITLDDYAVDGAEVRGLAVIESDVMVHLDNEFFVMRGSDPLNGWQFLNRQKVGLISHRSMAVGKRWSIWNDGKEFYLYAGGVASPISDLFVDSLLIDWTKAHSAVVFNDQYILHCEYDGEWSLIRYDTRRQAWRIRRSTALELQGICTDGQIVYGITPAGNLVDVYGGSDDDGAASVVRTIETRYYQVGDDQHDAQINQIVFDFVAPLDTTVSVVYSTLGNMNYTSDAKALEVKANKTRHTFGVNTKAQFIKVIITCTGTLVPAVHFIGFDIDGVPAQ